MKGWLISSRPPASYAWTGTKFFCHIYTVSLNISVWILRRQNICKLWGLSGIQRKLRTLKKMWLHYALCETMFILWTAKLTVLFYEWSAFKLISCCCFSEVGWFRQQSSISLFIMYSACMKDSFRRPQKSRASMSAQPSHPSLSEDMRQGLTSSRSHVFIYNSSVGWTGPI